jgi:DNA-binding NtrC family response regulator
MLNAYRHAGGNEGDALGQDHPKPAGHVRPATVLVVEDEVLIRVSVSDFLRECGFAVLDASNAAEARTILEAGVVVDLVFSDVQMPGEADGFALARWVRDHHPDVRVILTSGVVRMSEAAADLCGEAGFLAKPYDNALLADRIRQLLARGRRAAL